MRVCSLSHPSHNARAPHCRAWPVWLYHIFPHCLINGTIFGGETPVTEHKMRVLIFCTPFVWNISYFKNYWVRYDHRSIFVFFIIFPEYPSSGSRVIPCWRTDMTKLIVAYHFFFRTRLKTVAPTITYKHFHSNHHHGFIFPLRLLHEAFNRPRNSIELQD